MPQCSFRHACMDGIGRILHQRSPAALLERPQTGDTIAKRAGEGYADAARTAAYSDRSQHRIDR